jgi:putative SOS response-associated peptidase YedK
MCGRFNLFSLPESVKNHFHLSVAPEIQVDYNIHPGGDILTILPEAKAELLHWGLIPFWAKDRKMSYNLINARLETVAVKPSFRAAFKQRHVIIPATGCYEWRPIEIGTKQAYHITRSDQAVFGFAGLWEHWQQGDEAVNSCTIITTAANEKMQDIHSRMPVILEPKDYEHWLQLNQTKESLLALLANASAYDDMDAIPVSNFVNNPRHNGPECIEPVSLP